MERRGSGTQPGRIGSTPRRVHKASLSPIRGDPVGLISHGINTDR